MHTWRASTPAQKAEQSSLESPTAGGPAPRGTMYRSACEYRSRVCRWMRGYSVACKAQRMVCAAVEHALGEASHLATQVQRLSVQGTALSGVHGMYAVCGTD